MIYYGVFVCTTCAKNHIANFRQSENYVKDIYNEHWDDYQLRSIQIGGNKKLFEHMKEYKNGVEDMPIWQKYKHEVLTWYKKRHMHILDGHPIEDFKIFRPSRNMDDKVLKAYETVERKWDALSEKSEQLTQKAMNSQIPIKIGNKLVDFGSKIKTKFSKKEQNKEKGRFWFG